MATTDKQTTLKEKLAKARLDLQKMEIRKSGKSMQRDKRTNKLVERFRYAELNDFLPACTELAVKHRFLPIINFEDTHAELIITDFDSDETITFKLPMAQASVYQADDIQNVGAAQTYMRRYLYMAAFEIAIPDEVDSGNKRPEIIQESQQKPPQKTTKAKPAPQAAKERKNIAAEEVAKMQTSLAERLGLQEAKTAWTSMLAHFKVTNKTLRPEDLVRYNTFLSTWENTELPFDLGKLDEETE